MIPCRGLRPRRLSGISLHETQVRSSHPRGYRMSRRDGYTAQNTPDTAKRPPRTRVNNYSSGGSDSLHFSISPGQRRGPWLESYSPRGWQPFPLRKTRKTLLRIPFYFRDREPSSLPVFVFDSIVRGRLVLSVNGEVLLTTAIKMK